MSRSPVTMSLDLGRLQRAVAGFVRAGMPRVAQRASRTMAGQVAAETARLVGGADGAPRRVDTGDYQQAWEDAVVVSSGRGVESEASATNATPYGPELEHGTVNADGSGLAPGLHVARALITVRRDARPIVGAELAEAWNG